MAANRPEGHTPSAPAWCVADFPDLTAYSMIFSKVPGNADTLAELQAALTELLT